MLDVSAGFLLILPKRSPKNMLLLSSAIPLWVVVFDGNDGACACELKTYSREGNKEETFENTRAFESSIDIV
jgi:hypothetical protein